MKFIPSLGGYQPEIFVVQPNSVFNCGICLQIVCNPRQCLKGHIYCESCIVMALKYKPLCPTCKEYMPSRQLGACLVARRLLDDSEVSCLANLELQSTKEQRCDWTGPLHAAKQHYANCKLLQVKCSNPGCEESIHQDKLKKHVKFDCDFRTVPCHPQYRLNGCDWKGPLLDLLHHVDQCGYVPISCPLGCEDSTCIQRRLMVEHLEVCPRRPVRCTQNQCSWTGTHEELSGHMNNKCLFQAITCRGPNCGLQMERRQRTVHETNDCPDRQVPCKHLTCKWIGSHCLRDAHVRTCLNAPVVCKRNECGETLTRPQMAHHLKAKCKGRMVQCRAKGCGWCGTFAAFTVHKNESSCRGARLHG